ncbi:MAG: TIGR04283 family arsenosugar biosynthesis glycosyltransferase [Pseudomonadota bacterium]
MRQAIAISVVIPTLNAAARLAACLDALVGPTVDALVREVIVVDAGSTDATRDIADGFGARVFDASPGRGGQLRLGAETASSTWLLFLHGDTVLSDAWARDATAFMETGAPAAVFTLRFDARGIAPRLVASGAMLRTRIFKSPYGDQGLLVSRDAYDDIGGYRDMPLFEDVDIIKRLIKARGRGAVSVLSAHATTAADRYERNGYGRQVLANMWRVARFNAGVSPEKIAARYR